MSKKRKKSTKHHALAACERCGFIAKAQVSLRQTEGYQRKLGTIGLPRADRIRPLSPEAAFECAVEAGIYDRQGNLMPRYQ